MRTISLILTLTTLLTLTTFGQENNIEDDFCLPFPSASFPGGQDSLKSFIEKKLMLAHIDKSISGKVYIEFVVDIDGSVIDTKILKGFSDQYDRKALAIVSQMPKWIAAKKDDRPVKSKIIIPIIFKL